MSTNIYCCLLICVCSRCVRTCFIYCRCNVCVFQILAIESDYDFIIIMRHLAVILVSVLMMAAATYGLPAGGYSTDSDSYLTGLDQVDWNSVRNGGFAYINTAKDPITGQPTTKVTNSKSPWSEDANAKLSSGTGSAATTPSLLYDDSSEYNTPKDDTPLTKEEQEKYDCLEANLSPETPKSGTTNSVDKKKTDSTKLNQYDSFKTNVKPATTDYTQSSPQASATKTTWQPTFGNKVYTGGVATPTTSGAAYSSLSNDDYKYPSLVSDLTPTNKVQPTSYPRPTSYGSYGEQPSSSPSATTLLQNPTSKFSPSAVSSPSYDDLYSADLTTTDADSNYPKYSANTPTSRYSPSTANSLYPSASLQPSGGRYTGAQTAGTYNRGAVTSPSTYSSQKTFTPYTDHDADTMLLTKDNIDNYFPDSDS